VRKSSPEKIGFLLAFPAQLGIIQSSHCPSILLPCKRVKQEACALQRCNVGCRAALGGGREGIAAGIGDRCGIAVVALKQGASIHCFAHKIAGGCVVCQDEVHIAEGFADRCAGFVGTHKATLGARGFGVDGSIGIAICNGALVIVANKAADAVPRSSCGLDRDIYVGVAVGNRGLVFINKASDTN